MPTSRQVIPALASAVDLYIGLGRCKRSSAFACEPACPPAHESFVLRPSLGARFRRRTPSGSGQAHGRTRLVSNVRQPSQGSSRLRHAHHASDRQQHQFVVGASRPRAAPGSQSMDLERWYAPVPSRVLVKRGRQSLVWAAAPDSGQGSSSSKRVGRVCWPSCASSSIALTLPSRGRPQASFACLRPPLMSNVRPHRAQSS